MLVLTIFVVEIAIYSFGLLTAVFSEYDVLCVFRAGELGEENWPLMQVANDGKTVTTTNDDQPITFGKKVTEIWAGPQVAYR
ncbi:MAG: hypothetical protein V7K92_26450 [Nostoc sp.]|uniref:hypothetical protein n=1 Tax=Nostoc sp. TaxID=1180 RepID=UPI002FF39864